MRWWRWLAPAVAVAVGVAIGVLPVLPPPVDGDLPPNAFSTARARADIDWIAVEPRPIGSQANARVRDRIGEELAAFGLEPDFQLTTGTNWYGGSDPNPDVVNVVARIPGAASTGAVAVVGHYDTFPDSPGANDNASAVAIMLETARLIVAEDGLANDVIFVFTDGEEPEPRFGSTAFVEQHRWSGDIDFVINLESIGSGGPSLLIERSGPSQWVIDRYVDAVSYPAAFSFVTDVTALIGGSNTDFASFRDTGVAGVEFAYLGGSSIYHTTRDTPDRVGEATLLQQGQNTLDLVRHLGETDLGAERAEGSPQFFTVGRGTVLVYPGWLVLVGILVAAVALLISSGSPRTWWPAAARAMLTAAVSLAAVLLLSIVCVVIWMVLTPWRPEMSVTEGYAYFVLLVAVLGLGLVAVRRRSRSRRPATGTAEGTVLVWWLPALATMPVGLGISSLFALPALLAAIALGLRRAALPSIVLAAFDLLALVVAGVMITPAVDLFLQFAQPRPGNPDSEIVWTISIPLVLVGMVIELALSFDRSATPSPVSGRSSLDRGGNDGNLRQATVRPVDGPEFDTTR